MVKLSINLNDANTYHEACLHKKVLEGRINSILIDFNSQVKSHMIHNTKYHLVLKELEQLKENNKSTKPDSYILGMSFDCDDLFFINCIKTGFIRSTKDSVSFKWSLDE